MFYDKVNMYGEQMLSSVFVMIWIKKYCFSELLVEQFIKNKMYKIKIHNQRPDVLPPKIDGLLYKLSVGAKLNKCGGGNAVGILFQTFLLVIFI